MIAFFIFIDRETILNVYWRYMGRDTNEKKVKEINLPKGNFFIRITNIESPQETSYTGAPIYMMCNPDNHVAEPAVINGQKMEFPICICLN